MIEEPDELVRTQTFPANEPLDLDIGITIGRVEVELTDPGNDPAESADAVVRIAHDPGAQEPWQESMAGLLNWVGDQFGSDLNGSPADAVRQAQIDRTGNRLVVRGPKSLPLRKVPLAVTVTAPAGSTVTVRTGAAGVTVSGSAGRADLTTGSGDVSVDRAGAGSTVRTGTGSVRIDEAAGGLQVRSGSGAVEAASIAGQATVGTGTGGVWLGRVAGDVLVRSGSGDLTIAEAVSGSIELITGSGAIRIGVGSGVTAEIDISSGSGRVSSELEVSDSPPDGDTVARIRARTGMGDAVVTSAAR
ncbi:hypothetical protein SAMN05216266_11912 [Amycolatopsis marina]|uniref:DUF4097 domain-containing protein n=1 Tax=Amycolatopsis marina TaxID=490629 RepID=A0A1I1C071_9PSEU|nr:DUF4097 family beta strand repeat-containing protein [Amycolatopsis marina]SFB55512.1 hypothetical protein SAMN05216266_11912 [Amycolatopsis marina]